MDWETIHGADLILLGNTYIMTMTLLLRTYLNERLLGSECAMWSEFEEIATIE